MTYSPPATGQPDPVVLSSLTDDICNAVGFVGQGSGTGALTTGRAYFVPVRLAQRHTYQKAWWTNGSAVAGNVDVGIYTLSGTTMTRIVASTAEAGVGTNVVQIAGTFTPTSIGPGLFYLALSVSSSTAQFMRTTLATAALARMCGIFTSDSAHPLPSTATVASVAASASIAIFGFTELAVI